MDISPLADFTHLQSKRFRRVIFSLEAMDMTFLSFSFFSTRRFPGYSREGKKFDADVHRQHIFGLHVANYMTSLKDENPDAYAKQFSRFVKQGIEPTSVRIIGQNPSRKHFSLLFCSSKLCIKQLMPPFVRIHRHHRRKKRKLMHPKPNGRSFEREVDDGLVLFVFLVGTKLDLLVHLVEIVFNNERQLSLKRFKVAMLNKRSIERRKSLT